MRRTESSPRPAPVRSRAAQALAVVLASLALLVCGVVEVLPRSPGAPATAATAVALPVAGSSRPGTLEAPSSSLVARAAGLAAVPAPHVPTGGLPPSAGPLVAPHLVADPQQRPPTAPPVTAQAGSLSSRAPPGPAGT